MSFNKTEYYVAFNIALNLIRTKHLVRPGAGHVRLVIDDKYDAGQQAKRTNVPKIQDMGEKCPV